MHSIKLVIYKYFYIILIAISIVFISLLIIDLFNFLAFGQYRFFLFNNLNIFLNTIDIENITSHDFVNSVSGYNTWYAVLLSKIEVPLCLINGIVGIYQFLFGKNKHIYLLNILFSTIILLHILAF